jgi:hypothetical protein
VLDDLRALADIDDALVDAGPQAVADLARRKTGKAPGIVSTDCRVAVDLVVVLDELHVQPAARVEVTVLGSLLCRRSVGHAGE